VPGNRGVRLALGRFGFLGFFRFFRCANITVPPYNLLLYQPTQYYQEKSNLYPTL
jgi:hypothetical protein